MTKKKRKKEEPKVEATTAEKPVPTLELEAVSAGRADAKDYTTGSDPFGIKAAMQAAGGGGRGREVMAHEMTHATQQSDGGGGGGGHHR